MRLPPRCFALLVGASASFVSGCASGAVQAPQAVSSFSSKRASGSGCGSMCCPSLLGGTGLLTDGDFSQAIDLGTKWNHVFKGTVFAPYWVVSRGNVNFYGSDAWDVDGLCSVDLDGTPGPGGIASDAFATTVGQAYSVTFVLSGNGVCAPTIKKMEVGAAGQSEKFRWNTSGGRNAQHGYWSDETFKFIATNDTARLRFNSRDYPPSRCGAVVAGVAVTSY